MTISAFYHSLKDENGKYLKWKERKVLLKQQLRSIRRADEMSKGAKIVLTVLSILVALFLIGLVLALACSLSCDGSVAGAILVGVGGTALVILLFVLAIRAINGHKRRNKPKPDGATGS